MPNSSMKLYIPLLVLFVTSCSDSTTNTPQQDVTVSINPVELMQKTGVGFKMVNEKQRGKNNSTAMGFWRFLQSYPQLEGKIDESIKTKINNDIVTLANKYSCEDKKKSDYSFKGEVMFMNANIVSMTYETMWLCGRMPSPSSKVGALNYNLKTGEVVTLESQFVDSSADSRLSALLMQRFQADHSDNSDCTPARKHSYFYKAGNDLVFVADVASHAESGCITEVKIPVTGLKSFFKVDSILLD